MRDDERTGDGTPEETKPYEPPEIKDLEVRDAPLETVPGVTSA